MKRFFSSLLHCYNPLSFQAMDLVQIHLYCSQTMRGNRSIRSAIGYKNSTSNAAGYGWAEKKWLDIRESKDDVKRIATNTGIDEQTIQQIKAHIFHKAHKKRYETAPFDADYDMAKAWERLVAGNMVKADLELLKHEFAESLLMGNQEMDYDTAHNIVEKFFSWRNEL